MDTLHIEDISGDTIHHSILESPLAAAIIMIHSVGIHLIIGTGAATHGTILATIILIIAHTTTTLITIGIMDMDTTKIIIDIVTIIGIEREIHTAFEIIRV